jgi:hypothetical protein
MVTGSGGQRLYVVAKLAGDAEKVWHDVKNNVHIRTIDLVSESIIVT